MFKQNLQRGFTLIELLVVIAIIGILAATVLAALGTARSSGSDASVKGSMNSMKAQGEIYYTTSSTGYTGLCINSDFTRLITAVVANSPADTTPILAIGTAGSATDLACHEAADGASWAVTAPLNTTPVTYFCADSAGYSGATSTFLAANISKCI
jgi:prepilin-type N-terminal cleavage/methylation domain-containing protein